MTAAESTTSAELAAERDHWLRALDQLDAELADGDLSPTDHKQLADRYGANLAAVLRRLDTTAGSDAAPGSGPGPGSDPGPSPEDALDSGRENSGTRRWSTIAVTAALVCFAVGAGLILARTAGERGVRDQLSGAIDESTRTRVTRCQELGSIGGDLLGSLECFDEVLLDDPENAEALAYRGWYLLLGAGALQAESSLEDAEVEELTETGLEYLRRAIEADPLLPDPLAFRATVYDRQGRAADACRDVAALVALDPPPFFLNQTAAIAERNAC